MQDAEGNPELLMGPTATQGGGGKARGGRGKRGEKILDKSTQVECSGCGRWVKAGDVDVAGLPASEVAEMDVFCLRCVYSRLAESRSAWQESQDENKALCEMI